MSDNVPPRDVRPKRPLSTAQKAEIAAKPYDSGFAKPPKASQFAPGVSGNPAGRPKGARSLRTDLEEVLGLEVAVQMPGGARSVSVQHAMVLKTAVKAVGGDVRAALVVLKMMELSTPERLKELSEETKLDPIEQEMMAKLLVDLGVGDPPSSEEGSSVTRENDDEDFDIL